MATLIPEDGTGVANANTWATLSFYLTYMENRARDEVLEPVVTEEQIIAGLLYGASDLSVGFQWKGLRLTKTQGLEVPRNYWYREDDGSALAEMPLEVKHAQCERAADHLSIAPVHESLDPASALDALKLGPIELDFARAGLPPLAENNFINRLLAAFVESKIAGFGPKTTPVYLV